MGGAPGANDGETQKTNSEINSFDVNAIVEMAESGKVGLLKNTILYD